MTWRIHCTEKVESLKETAATAGEAEEQHNVRGYFDNTPAAQEGRVEDDMASAILNLHTGNNEGLCTDTVVGLGCSFNDQLTVDSELQLLYQIESILYPTLRMFWGRKIPTLGKWMMDGSQWSSSERAILAGNRWARR
jgi:hypothetical protein